MSWEGRKEVGEEGRTHPPANLNQLQFDDKDTAAEEFLVAYHLTVHKAMMRTSNNAQHRPHDTDFAISYHLPVTLHTDQDGPSESNMYLVHLHQFRHHFCSGQIELDASPRRNSSPRKVRQMWWVKRTFHQKCQGVFVFSKSLVIRASKQHYSEKVMDCGPFRESTSFTPSSFLWVPFTKVAIFSIFAIVGWSEITTY